FFFSSRRRHTRSYGDWSSDVCSSDLSVQRVKPGDRVLVSQEHGCYAEQIVARDSDCHVIPDAMSFIEAAAMGLTYQTAYFALIRSEERRVGKECTAGRWEDQCRKRRD